jgi:ATP-dependent helicase HepA
VQGMIVVHRVYGYGKIVAATRRGVRVQFCETDQEANFTSEVFARGDLKHARLNIDDRAVGPHGACVIVLPPRPGSPITSIFSYGIQYENGLTETVSEVDLTPVSLVRHETPLGRLSSYRPHVSWKVTARERLMTALSALDSQVGGLRALLASRIDLHPHQAFVAGCVILDRRRRYILADEVGLGKTIEAGVIIHDLLLQKPSARILILTPGALCRQWLCEMHSSFGGQGLRLLDLYEPSDIRLTRWPRVICSTSLALRGLGEKLTAAKWDLVVVDEAHHLIGSESLYTLVQQVAVKSRDLLLLSAIPASRREDEFLKLLALLEPDRYEPGRPARERFRELYQAQPLLGRRLNRLSREIRDARGGEASSDDLIELVENLLDVPVVRDDGVLRSMLKEARNSPIRVTEVAEAIRADVVDRYRVNRRILRNRRRRLIETNQLLAVRRVVEVHDFGPTQIELEAHHAVEALVRSVREKGCPTAILRPFARLAAHSLCHAPVAYELLLALKNTVGRALPAKATEFINLSPGTGYDDWELVEDLICTGAKPYAESTAVTRALDKVAVWCRVPNVPTRLETLRKVVEGYSARGSKVIVFAGFPGLAQNVIEFLAEQFGRGSVTSFTYNLPDEAKEENVRRFRQDDRTVILVADETGGEGRNFQFVTAIIHFDLPWIVSPIEQRIGRLDRLGREADVISHVLMNRGGLESGLYTCLKEGFGVFDASISGLEFALRDQQDKVIDAAVEDGIDGLVALAPILAKEAEDERATDEGEALLDEASFDSVRANRFRRTPNPGIDNIVEEGFVEYFRSIARRGSARSIAEERIHSRLWVFHPDEVRDEPLANVDDAQRERKGTFHRDVARARRDLEFFNFGDPIFDSVVATALDRATGRTFALRGTARGLSPFIGVEIQVLAQPNLRLLGERYGLANRATMVFGMRRIPVAFSIGETIAIEDRALREAIEGLRSGTMPAADISAADLARLVAEAQVDWAAYLRSASDTALRVARGIFETQYGGVLADELATIREQQRVAERDSPGEAEEEIRDLECLARAVQEWVASIDTLGFIAINAVRNVT